MARKTETARQTLLARMPPTTTPNHRVPRLQVEKLPVLQLESLQSLSLSALYSQARIVGNDVSCKMVQPWLQSMATMTMTKIDLMHKT